MFIDDDDDSTIQCYSNGNDDNVTFYVAFEKNHIELNALNGRRYCPNDETKLFTFDCIHIGIY